MENRLLGYRVIANVAVPKVMPKLQMRRMTYVSDHVRKEFNQFLEKNFGYTPCALVSKEHNAIFVHPENKHIFDRIPVINQPNEDVPFFRRYWPESFIHHVLRLPS